MSPAPAPSRASGTLTIGFGLLSITCAVYAGVEDVKIKRSMRTPEGNPVGFQTFDKATGDEVERHLTYMVFETEDGTEVPLTDEEIASAMGEDNGSAEILGFYPLSEIDRYTVSNVMQVRPKKDGKKDPFAKPFALMMGAMADREVFALIRWTLRGSPAYGVLTSTGKLLQVRWADEVREARPMPGLESVSTVELGMASQLVDALTKSDAPVLENDAAEKVRAYAETKALSIGKDKAETPESVRAAVKQNFNDLTAMLEASLAKGTKEAA